MLGELWGQVEPNFVALGLEAAWNGNAETVYCL